MKYHRQPFCSDCLDRQIADADEIMAVLSDPKNHYAERMHLMDLCRERIRLREESDRTTLPPEQIACGEN